MGLGRAWRVRLRPEWWWAEGSWGERRHWARNTGLWSAWPGRSVSGISGNIRPGSDLLDMFRASM